MRQQVRELRQKNGPVKKIEDFRQLGGVMLSVSTRGRRSLADLRAVPPKIAAGCTWRATLVLCTKTIRWRSGARGAGLATG